MITALDINKYKQQRDELKQRFEDKKTGKQTFFTEQSTLFKPLVETQKEISKAIQDKIEKSQDVTSNALVPFIRELQKELQRRNDQNELPFYNYPLDAVENIAQSTPIKE